MRAAALASCATNTWRFANPVAIRFGDGVRAEARVELAGIGDIAVISTPSGRARIEADPLLSWLDEGRRAIWLDDVEENPDIDAVGRQAQRLSASGISAIVAIGGGSVMDTAKALGIALAAPEEETLRRLVADPARLARLSPPPLIVMPTTAGTGSEVTPFATLWDRTARKKLSLAGRNTYATTAYVDPQLTHALPQAVTVSTGLDAINQAAESIWNRNASPITLQLATRALALGLKALPGLIARPHDARLRRAMSECSLLAGIAISHTRTALCHSMSYPLTSHFGVPHGLACAFTMLAVYRLNLSYDDGRFAQLATALGFNGTMALESALEYLLQDLRVAERVRTYLPGLDETLGLAGEMFTPGRADNNLAAVDHNAICTILKDSYNAK